MFNLATVGDGLIAIAAPDPDPNTTPPAAARIFTIPSTPNELNVWLVAQGGGPTVELWVQVPFLAVAPAVSSSRWFRWNNATIVLVADQMIPLSTGKVAKDVQAFLRVTVVGGATRVALGMTS